MEAPWPAGVRVERNIAGETLVLPRSRARGVREFAGAACFVGMFFVAMPTAAMVLVLPKLFSSGRSGAIVSALLAGAFFLVFAAAGAGMVWLGMLLVRGRTEVEVRDGRVLARLRLGPTRIGRIYEASTLSRIVVSRTPDHRRVERAVSATWDHFNVLLEARGKRGAMLSVGRDRAWSEALARALREWLLQAAGRGDKGRVLPVRVIDDQYTPREVSGRRSGKSDGGEEARASSVIVQRNERGVSLEVPPSGMRGTARFFAIFGVMFAVLGVIFIAVSVVARTHVPFFAFAGIGTLFFAVGALAVVYGGHLATRAAIIDAVDGAVLVSMRSALRSTQRQFGAGEVTGVRMGPSNTTVNGRRVPELQIRTSARTHGFLLGRSEVDLTLLSRELQTALAVEPVLPDEAPDDEPDTEPT